MMRAKMARLAAFVGAVVVTVMIAATAIAQPVPAPSQVKPIVPQAREKFVNKQFLAHLEKAAQRYEAWVESRNPGSIAAMREFMRQMRPQAAKAA